MAEETFTCDRCGNEHPRRQMKEAFSEEGKERVRQELCPSCLDEVMNAAGNVRGVAGEEKRAAVHVDPEGSGDGESGARRESFGQRND